MRHAGHIRQRSPGSWEIRYGLGTDSATGKCRKQLLSKSRKGKT
jgi:hypothetical protein